ncbi:MULTISPECIES: polysaccharide deacetylase family protein [unclassified Bradyrhizobium]|uniref:polysaccharide deacetylase family protein n=1 Tax=unclassified Bradyrhizobium TaxID=2631580 RepID=UPI0028EE04B9|nr:MULTISPECIES: polysaccharide deacetylase family protein [unclassified Bradyrhizobium]
MTWIGVELVRGRSHEAVAGWRGFLLREGLPFVEVDAPTGRSRVVVALENVSNTDFGTDSVVILDGVSPPIAGLGCGFVSHVETDGERVRVGGIAELYPARPFWPAIFLQTFVDEGSPSAGRLYSACVEQAGRFYLPLALGELLVARGSGFHPYPLPGTDTAAEVERVEILLAAVDHNGICRILSKVLRLAFTKANVPYVRKWYYPTVSSSIFLGRLDIDVVDASILMTTASRFSAYGRRATFFANASGEEETEDSEGKRVPSLRCETEGFALACLSDAGHEIANHGYWHTVFSERGRCIEDIGRAQTVLGSLCGSPPKGYGGPGGVWYPSVAEAVVEHGLSYSSELGCGYDGLPFWTAHRGDCNAALQIPVSPYLQCLLAGQPTIDQFRNGWSQFVRRCLARNEPISFIFHPGDFVDGDEPAIDILLEYPDVRRLPDMTFHQFAQWWSRRDSIRIEAAVVNSKIQIRADQSIPIEVNNDLMMMEGELITIPATGL